MNKILICIDFWGAVCHLLWIAHIAELCVPVPVVPRAIADRVLEDNEQQHLEKELQPLAQQQVFSHYFSAFDLTAGSDFLFIF